MVGPDVIRMNSRRTSYHILEKAWPRMYWPHNSGEFITHLKLYSFHTINLKNNCFRKKVMGSSRFELETSAV
jgi:hypothetical protein